MRLPLLYDIIIKQKEKILLEEIILTCKTKNEKTYKILSLFFGIMLVFSGLIEIKIINIFIGALLIYYFTYNKNIFLSEEGVVYQYKSFLLNKNELLPFSDIDEITVIAKGKNSIIYFISGPIAKKMVVDSEIIEEAIDFIKGKTKIQINYE